MSYLKYFHFDREPFPTAEMNNYFYENKKQTHIIDHITNLMRFNSGIYTITGGRGVGKTTLLKMVTSQVQHNDLSIFISVNESTNINKSIRSALSILQKKSDIEDIVVHLNKFHKKGQNVILLIDNSENLSKEELVALSSLVYVIPYLRVVLCGNKTLNKKLKDKSLNTLRRIYVQKYTLSYTSFIGCIMYIQDMSNSALSLIQYKQIINFLPSVFLSFLSNRNFHNVNFIATESIKNAYMNKNKRVTLKDIYYAGKNNFYLIKYNIYLKFQKIFFYTLIIISAYFMIKIITERQQLINKIEVQALIKEQEKTFQNIN